MTVTPHLQIQGVSQRNYGPLFTWSNDHLPPPSSPRVDPETTTMVRIDPPRSHGIMMGGTPEVTVKSPVTIEVMTTYDHFQNRDMIRKRL